MIAAIKAARGRINVRTLLKDQYVRRSIYVGVASLALPLLCAIHEVFVFVASPLCALYNWLAILFAVLFGSVLWGVAYVLGHRGGGDADPINALLLLMTFVGMIPMLPVNWVVNGKILKRFMERRPNKQAAPNGGPSEASGPADIMGKPPSMS